MCDAVSRYGLVFHCNPVHHTFLQALTDSDKHNRNEVEARSPSRQALITQYGKRVVDTTWRCAASLLLEGVAGGAGTLVYPGVGTFIGQLVGGTVIWLV